MSDARTEILARIRTANSGQPPAGAIPRDYALVGDLSGAGREPALLEQFAERVADYRATVVRCGPGEVAATLAAQLRDRGLHRIAVAAQAPDLWFSRVTGVDILRDSSDLDATVLDGVDAAVTGAAAGIAETGTVVLDGSPLCGRRIITLIPDTHLCVIRADQIVASVPEALARLQPTAPTTFISGPSATSDIELKRVEGVHGPRTLVVVLVS